MGDGGELPLRATDNERYSVSGGSTSENKTDKQNSVRLLEAKEEKKKEAFVPNLGLERSLRSGQEPPPARTGAQYACTTRPVLSQSNNLLGTEYLVGMAAV